jgi:hypothetical protein
MAEKHPKGHYGIFQQEYAHQVAEVFDRNTSPKMVEANANLIAAAPELLDALRELLASVTCEGTIDTRLPIAWSGSPAQNHRMHAALKGARATLGKASGQNARLCERDRP